MCYLYAYLGDCKAFAGEHAKDSFWCSRHSSYHQYWTRCSRTGDILLQDGKPMWKGPPKHIIAVAVGHCKAHQPADTHVNACFDATHRSLSKASFRTASCQSCAVSAQEGAATQTAGAYFWLKTTPADTSLMNTEVTVKGET